MQMAKQKYDFSKPNNKSILQIFALDSICKLTTIQDLQINSRMAIVNFQTQKHPILQFQPKKAANLQTPIANSNMQQN